LICTLPDLLPPPVEQAISFGKAVFADQPGLAASKLAATYLLIGCAYLGSNNLQQAELYLTQANWVICQVRGAGIAGDPSPRPARWLPVSDFGCCYYQTSVAVQSYDGC